MSDSSSPPLPDQIRRVAGRIRDAVMPRRTARPGGRKHIDLALQGGGAHGAFTWGVLDALLEDGRLAFDAISGTSAGAMNAVVLADGLSRGGPERAREQLHTFWRSISREGGPLGAADDVLDRLLGFWQMPSFSPFTYFQRFTGFVSPYAINPLNINPLKDLIARLVDFDAVRACAEPRLFISATNVRNGKIRVFTGADVTAEAIAASACLPYLFQAVEIGDEAYWDGGYMGNPALFPFFDGGGAQDILLVQINPVERTEVPRTATAIVERVSEITFNASLLREFRAIDFVNRMLAEKRLDPKRYRHNRLHRIDAGTALAHHSASSKLDTSWRFFEELRDAGREAARGWLAAHFDDIGVKATLDLRREFM
jgi:NTE family protein